jgi:flagellar motor protein MotB
VDAGTISRAENALLEQHREQLWKANLATIEERLRADSIEHMVSNKDLTFASGSATPINPGQALSLLDFAYQCYARGYNRIQVEGYTDNVAIRTTQFPSNWELSAARAIWLATKIEQDLGKRGIRIGRDVHVEAIGYGDQHPLADNATEPGRDRNRRIEMRFERDPVGAQTTASP